MSFNSGHGIIYAMARNRVPKPAGWKGGSDDFSILSTGYAGRTAIEKLEDYSPEELRSRKNCKKAGDSWDDFEGY